MPPIPLVLVLVPNVTVLPKHLLYNPLLDNKLILLEKMKNGDQIYNYLLKLSYKLIGANSNCRKDVLWLQKINAFNLSKNLV